MEFGNFYLNRVILELRYNDGFLYLDNCGAALLEVRKKFPEWKWERTTTELTVLKEKSKNMEFLFNSQNIRFIQNEVDNLNQFKKATASITPIILEKIQIEEFSRVGNRFFYHLPLNNIDEGEKIIQKSRFVEIVPEKLGLFGDEPKKKAFTIYIENKGLQYRIKLSTIERFESPKNVKINEKFHPKYGLRIDVDIAIIKKVNVLDFFSDKFIQSNYKFLENNLIKFVQK